MALVRVLPMYPRRAREQGLEGQVILQLTIAVTGTVEDIVVLESSHSIFEKAAVRASAKFKYRARIVNGQPGAVTGIRHKLTFEIEN